MRPLWTQVCGFSFPSEGFTTRLFLTSVSLVILCLLFSSVDYVPVKGEIIWYLMVHLHNGILHSREKEGA